MQHVSGDSQNTPMDSSLLHRYRLDRRNLLDFILSSGLIEDIRSSSTSDIDFDAISADYVLECIQSGGGVLDVSKATSKHIDESMLPATIHSERGDAFFLLSDPDSAGSPPRRAPPSLEDSYDRQRSSTLFFSNGSEATVSGIDLGVNPSYTVASSSKSAKKTDVPSLGLPDLRTGLSDDDLRESAYEVLLSCIAFSGIAIHSSENPKKDKGSRFLTGLKNRRGKRHLRSHSTENQFEHIDNIRVQMQISEAMDECIRQRLMQFSTRKSHVQVDIPQIIIELLSGIQQNEFLVERSYTQWRKRQANVLEELFSSVNYPEMQELGILLDKIRNPEEWNVIMTPAERAEVLLAIRQVASSLSSMRGSSHIQGGSNYWNAGYHLNIRLYERLLFGVFDILDEGQLIEEHADYLKLVKLTWVTLGITQKMHDALYGWVLFQQFIETEELQLLDQANLQLQKVLSDSYKERTEDQYTDNLVCTVTDSSTETRLSLVQAIFRAISLWCDSRLHDYHLHFREKPIFFQKLVFMGLAVGTDNSGTDNEVKLTNFNATGKAAAVRARLYVERSLDAACRRIEDTINLISKMEGKHPLALLASEVRVVAERELSVFSSVLCQWCPDAGVVASVHLHQYYGKRLKPFLENVSLSVDAISVLSAAHHLELYLIQAFNSKDGENDAESFFIHEIDFYEIHKISRPIILDWLISQHERILEWTGRTFHLEVWEPLSNQQKQAASVVEVFRIVEETVDHLFGLSLPMDISHLQALLSIIFHALDGYLQNLVSQLVEKKHLYPAAPPLTRYKETMFPIVKKKVLDSVILEEEVDEKLKGLTAVKLCVRLNTLEYMQKQIDILEDGIKKSWASTMVSGNSRDPKLSTGTTDFTHDSEAVDELFVATFDSIRDSIANAIRKNCDLVGTRVVFWDLRDSFLFRLYHGSVEGARLENLLPKIDSVLNQVCGLIEDTLRDMVVASICRAALEAYVWILLDGGPSCAFSDSDVTMMEEDLNMLKDLFVADGEGLPRSLVEMESKLAHQVLSLFSLDAESVIHMLMMASENLSTGFGSGILGQRSLDDANTLIRVLCHMKDKEASRFLKLHYHLPPSSDYVDSPSNESTPKAAMGGAEFLRSASVRWGEKGNSSFRLLKKRFQGGSFRWS